MAYWTESGSSSDEDDVDQRLSVDTLVMRARDGDQQAFEMLYMRYNGQISRYLSRIVGNVGVGGELTQEAFLKVWSSLPKLRTPELFVRWLYRIALNCAYDYQRCRKQVQVIPLDLCASDEEVLSIEGPERDVANAELFQIALARVSPLYRACLILYVVEELPQRQIAERLSIKGTNVSKYVSRGKAELRQVYNELLKEQDSVKVMGGRVR